MKKMMEFQNTCFSYQGVIALRYINLTIFQGETIVLQGSNGCGKSTLLKLMNGLIYPEEGTYFYDGHEITEKQMKKSRFSKWFHQRMGFVFQNADIQLFCNNVEEEIAFGPLQMGLSEEEVRGRVDDVIRLLDIDKLRDRAPYHLSGGEKRKVALACVLSMNPQVLVLDEPLAGLDRKTQLWLTDFLKQLKAAGKTIVISTHNEELAHALASRIVYMNDDHSIEKIEVCG